MKVAKVQSQDIDVLYQIVNLIESVADYGEIPYGDDYSGERVPEIGTMDSERLSFGRDLTNSQKEEK